MLALSVKFAKANRGSVMNRNGVLSLLAITLMMILMLWSVHSQVPRKASIGQDNSFSVKFEFRIPIVFLNISNETGYTNNMKDSIVAHNVGDKDASIEYRYKVSPANPNITVEFSKNNFVLRQNQSVETYVNISIGKGTVSGEYLLTIKAIANPYPSTSGNTINCVQTYSIKIYVSGKAYRLQVITRQPDGKPAVSLIKVAYITNGTVNYIYQDYGYNITFYVVQGQYRVEAWFGGEKRAEETVNVTNNLTLILQYSLIRIRDIQVVSQPRSPQDNLIFKFTIENDDPLVYKRVVDIRAYLYRRGESEPLLSNIPIATITIRSTMTESLIGALPAPNGNWTNGSYILRLVAFCGDVVMENVSTEIAIVVIMRIVVVEQSYVPLIPLLMVALIAGLIGYLSAMKTTRIIRPVSRVPFRIRRIGIIARGTLLGLYDFTKRRALIMSDIDRLYPSLIALIKNMESLHPTSWVLETRLPLAWSIGVEKFLIYPIDEEFSVFISTNPRVSERDPKVIRSVRSIASYIKRLHTESGLSYSYIMKHQSEYRYYLRRIADFVRSLKLAVSS